MRAARLLGAAETLRLATSHPVPEYDRREYEETIALARAAAGSRGFARARAEGRGLGREERIAVGTGPYRFVQYVKNDRLVVERFEGYWDQTRLAKARRITFPFIGDPQTRSVALRSGEVDIVIDVPRDQTAQLEAPGLKLLRAPPGSSNGLVWNIAGTGEHAVGRDPTGNG